MAKKTKPNSSRHTVDDFVALNLLVPKAIKESLEHRAQKSGATVNALAIMLLDPEELHRQVGSIVLNELDGRYGHHLSFVENFAGIIDLFSKSKKKIQN